MANVVIYSKSYCPYCVKAKNFFKERNVQYTEHNMDERFEELQDLKNKTGHMTLPQIFINDEFIGGFSDLEAANVDGKIDQILKK